MSDAEVVELPPGALVHDRYLVTRPVGQGGLSTVYQVNDTHAITAHVYALKEQRDLSLGARKQFAREAGWLKALDHPNIPKVTAFFEWHGRLYLVMEFIAGENLEQKLERAGGRPLPEPQVLAWVLPICDALNYLHTRTPPILHRDVKPANIIVTPMGRPVLVDLGIAKEHGPVGSKTATFVRKAGTEGYAPPEQYAASGLSGPWSDVYGFGATVYHLLTAQIPPTAVERVALDAPLAPPSAYNASVSKPTDGAIMRALAVRPQDRFPSMVQLKGALQAGTHAAEMYMPVPRPPSHASPTNWSGSLPSSERSQIVPPTPSATGHPIPAPHIPVAASHASGALPGRVSGSSANTSARPVTGKRAATSAVGIDDPPAAAPATRQSEGSRAVVWWIALGAVLLLGAIAVVFVLRVYAPIDQSTPTASVTGYFNAVAAQDYSRAWHYTANSTNTPNAQASFIQNAQAEDTLSGRLLSYHITASQGDGGAHATVSVTLTRADAPQQSTRETVSLTQYSGNWLIDSILPG